MAVFIVKSCTSSFVPFYLHSMGNFFRAFVYRFSGVKCSQKLTWPLHSKIITALLISSAWIKGGTAMWPVFWVHKVLPEKDKGKTESAESADIKYPHGGRRCRWIAGGLQSVYKCVCISFKIGFRVFLSSVFAFRPFYVQTRFFNNPCDPQALRVVFGPLRRRLLGPHSSHMASAI